MIAGGFKSFYKVENGVRLSYSPAAKKYTSPAAAGQDTSAFIVMKNFSNQNCLEEFCMQNISFRR
jgi:hypothetical protein